MKFEDQIDEKSKISYWFVENKGTNILEDTAVLLYNACRAL